MAPMIWFWIILALIVLMVLFKFKEIRHKIGLITIAIIALFFVFSFLQLRTIHKIDLTTFDGVLSAGRIYVSWMGNVVSNIVGVSSYVVDQQWGINVSNLSGK